jgi:TolB-like protein/DNA-binding winged helix-turn-helix (wHTH) protein/tetratricopeptide (TPR) repeat protein
VTAPPSTIRFGPYELDAEAGQLLKDRRAVRLKPQPFKLLLLLASRPGEVIGREEIRTLLWGADTFVDFDHGLNAAMNRLRTSLGDTAENPRFIQTLPRRGYRFIAPVETVFPRPSAVGAPVGAESAGPADSLPGPARSVDAGSDRPWWRRGTVAAVAGVTLVAALAAGYVVSASRHAPHARPMMAVLPFQNLSGSTDQDYFSDGFTEEIIAQLGALNPDALGVIARSTVARYRDGRQSVAEIGRALDVEYVLEGSIRRAGDQVRITAQLIDVNSQTQLWAESYDHDVRDVLLTQRDVAMRVADALTMSVLRVSPVRRMTSPDAYDATLRGWSLRQQATEASLARAREYFERAIALDPTYAPAHAGLADVYVVLAGPGWEFDRPRDLLPKARDAAQHAIDLDPRLPDGFAVRGLARMWLTGDLAGAEEDVRHAIALNDSYAMAHRYLSTVLVASGRPAEAVDAARRALQLDPLAPASGTTVAYRLYYAGDFTAALREFDRALEGSPDYVSAWIGKAQCFRALGRAEDARQAVAAAATRSGGRSYVEAYRAYSLALDGDAAGARAIQRQLETLAATQYVPPFDFALIAAGLKDGAEVQRQLARVRDDGSGWAVFLPIEREFAPFLKPGS